MSFLIRLIIFPIILVRRLLWPMFKTFLKTPFATLKIILKSRLVLLAACLGIIYFGMQASNNKPVQEAPEPMPMSKEENPATRTPVTELPEIKGTIENGNSSFAKKLWQKMDKPNQVIYSREFNYTMQYVPAGETHLYRSTGDVLFGRIQPSEPYQAKSGVYCRNFKELTSFKGEAQTFHGKACQRATGPGWCKLGPESTPTCELGYSEGTFGSIKRSFRRWF